MKILITALILLGSVAIYEPGSLVIPKWRVEKTPTGELKIYRPGKYLVPAYRVKGGRIYKPGSPLLPTKIIEEEERWKNKGHYSKS